MLVLADVVLLVAHLEGKFVDSVADLWREHARISLDTVAGHESDLVRHTQEHLNLLCRRHNLVVVQRAPVPVGHNRGIALTKEQEVDHREVLARRRLDAAVADPHVHQVWYISEKLEFWQELPEVVDEAGGTEGAEGERQVLHQPGQLLVELL